MISSGEALMAKESPSYVSTRNTGCPIDMLTSSDSILQILKPHIPKGKTCFEILVKKAFRWHLETWENQTESIFKFKIKKKKKVKFQKRNSTLDQVLIPYF